MLVRVCDNVLCRKIIEDDSYRTFDVYDKETDSFKHLDFCENCFKSISEHILKFSNSKESKSEPDLKDYKRVNRTNVKEKIDEYGGLDAILKRVNEISITRTAKELGISQASLSRYLKKVNEPDKPTITEAIENYGGIKKVSDDAYKSSVSDIAHKMNVDRSELNKRVKYYRDSLGN